MIKVTYLGSPLLDRTLYTVLKPWFFMCCYIISGDVTGSSELKVIAKSSEYIVVQ